METIHFHFIGTIACHHRRPTNWVLTQKTFTKWANVPLNGAHIINDVEKDLDDGFVPIALFEALRKQKVNFKNDKNLKMRVALLENTNQALKFLIADGVKLVNIVRRTSSTVV